jgi:hypothetical protein
VSRKLLSQQHRQLLSLLAQPLGKHDDIKTYALGSMMISRHMHWAAMALSKRVFGDVCMLGEESHW